MKDLDPTVTLSTTPALRKKGTGVRTWIVLDCMGQTQMLEAGKYAIMRKTGLPARDLRVLDPFLSYPSTVLGREKAIVINLEHIKAIITAKEVLLLNSMDPFVSPFLKELQVKIVCHYQATKAEEGTGDDANWRTLWESEGPQSQLLVSPQKILRGSSQLQDQDKEYKAQEKHAFKNQDGSKVLPFEFVALESCLEAACSSLDDEAKTLELEAHPALDKLTSQISTLNLERVRQIKSRLVAITGRVQKVRDELEHLLDRDEDMAEMYLTDKLVQQNLENSSTSSTNEGSDIDDEDVDMDDREHATEVLMEAHGASTSYKGDIRNNGNEQDHFFSARKTLGRESQGTHGSPAHSAMSKPFNVGELEMLLEAYFVEIDGTLNKLSTLREYVDDTEDYINIMLDDKQNQLLQMGVLLTTATLVMTIIVVLTGIMGMNIRIHLFNLDVSEGMPKWLWTTFTCVAGAIALYVSAVAWYKQKGYI